jgi:serine/threonine protein kinase/tetratricopeptide (TPR) repeat protein
MMLSAGTRLGPYEIVAPLGAGGMGVVYRARDSRLHREVAIKVIAENLAQDADAIRRFEQETRAVAALSHPNILALHDIGQAEVALTDRTRPDGGASDASAASAASDSSGASAAANVRTAAVPFAVTELLDGESLRARLTRTPLTWRQAAAIARAIADGLAFAHGRGIVHRDLKPENVFLTSDGRVKILDFGLAHAMRPLSVAASNLPTVAVTLPGAIVGTIGYASPEQIRGEAAGPASDIFSLGCILYEMVAGRRAFEAPTAADTLASLLNGEPPSLLSSGSDRQVPLEFERIVNHCLTKKAPDRLQSARALGIALDALLSDAAFLTPGTAAPWITTPAPGDVAAAYIAGLAHAAPPASPAPAPAHSPSSSSSSSRPSGSAPASGSNAASMSTPTPRVRASRSRGRSLAVLPFTTDDDSADAAYLSDGITESLINSLAAIPKLRVVPRSTVFRLKGRDLDPLAAGAELDVKTLLTGRIARRGEMLTIQAELVDVAHESQLWGHQYTRNVADILTLQETIAREISDALKLKLSGTDKKKLTKRATENTDAYEDYLRARYFFNKYTPDGFDQAVKCCEAAITKDPGYALAYATLADTYGSAAFFGYVLPQEGVQKADAAARKALELGPNLAEAHHALAKESFFFRRDWATAERAFLRALELNPRMADCRMYYALMLIVLGRRDEALKQAQQALDDDPLSGIVNTAMVLVHLFTGQFDAGLTRAHRALQLDPNLVLVRQVLAFAYEQKEEFDTAIDYGGPLMAMAPGVDPRPMLDKLREAWKTRGKRGYWEERLQMLRDMAARRYVPPFVWAYVYTRLDDFDRAFEYLERAYTVSSGMIVFMAIDYAYAPLRSDPRFDVLLRKMGLPKIIS